MSELPVLPLWVTKYEGNTAHLTLEEDGAYTRLLRLLWRTPGCSIPTDAGWIMRHMRVDQTMFERVVQPILTEFFEIVSGRWHSQKLTEVYQDADAKTKRRQAAGSKGGKAKALKTQEPTSSNATALPEQCSSKPEPKPEPIKKEKKQRPASPESGELFASPGFRKRCVEAAGACLKPRAREFDLIVSLCEGGREVAVLAEIETIAEGKPAASISTWKYFATAISNRRAQVAAKPKAIGGDVPMTREEGKVEPVWLTLRDDDGKPYARRHRETGLLVDLQWQPIEGAETVSAQAEAA